MGTYNRRVQQFESYEDIIEEHTCGVLARQPRLYKRFRYRGLVERSTRRPDRCDLRAGGLDAAEPREKHPSDEIQAAGVFCTRRGTGDARCVWQSSFILDCCISKNIELRNIIHELMHRRISVPIQCFPYWPQLDN
jgi:hypothetical protein